MQQLLPLPAAIVLSFPGKPARLVRVAGVYHISSAWTYKPQVSQIHQWIKPCKGDKNYASLCIHTLTRLGHSWRQQRSRSVVPLIENVKSCFMGHALKPLQMPYRQLVKPSLRLTTLHKDNPLQPISKSTVMVRHIPLKSWLQHSLNDLLTNNAWTQYNTKSSHYADTLLLPLPLSLSRDCWGGNFICGAWLYK